MSKRGLICEEIENVCHFCKKVDELRPYGPSGENICFDCAMKDEETTARRFKQHVLGEGFDA